MYNIFQKILGCLISYSSECPRRVIIFLALLLSTHTTLAQQVSGPDPVTSGQTYTYTYTSSFPSYVSWSISGGMKVGQVSDGIYHTVWVTWNAIGNGIITCYEGSKSYSDYVTIRPAIPRVIPGKRCGTGTVALAATPGNGGFTTRWYTAPTGGTHFHESVAYTTPVLTTSTTYYVTSYSAPYGESTIRTPITATIEDVPTNAPGVTDGIRFGAGTVTLTASGAPAGGSYKWYSASNTLLATGATYTTPTLSPSTLDNYLYVKATNTINCEGPPTWVNVRVYATPVITGEQRAYLGKKALLTCNTGYAKYEWFRAGDLSNALKVSTTDNTYVAGAGTYVVRVTGSGLMATSAPFKVSSYEEQNENYVISNMIQTKGVTGPGQVEDLAVDQNAQTIQYFDGLGRLKQTVITQASPQKHDVVQPVTYDVFGREQRRYLPVAPDTEDGWFKPNILDASGNYAGVALNLYNNGASDKIADDSKPYAQTVFEASPLNRPLAQGAPGEAWQPASVPSYSAPMPTDHSIKYAYDMNEDSEVLRWTYISPMATYPLGVVHAGTVIAPDYFAANQLRRKRIKGEHQQEIIEYTDKEGRVILKRVQSVPGSPTPTGQDKDKNYASTYYIYDEVGNLVCVLPPEATSRLTTEYYQSGSTDATKNEFLRLWAYRYTFDGRRRMTQKQVPGAEPVYMVYDDRNRLVMMQDGNMRVGGQWQFTKYDAFNRPVLVGIHTADSVLTQTKMQRRVNEFYADLTEGKAWFETYTSDGGVLDYDNKSYPQETNASSYLTATYYDGYAFASTWGQAYAYKNEGLSQMVNNVTYTQPETALPEAIGLVTGTQIRKLGSGEWLRSVTYYDDAYRVIQTNSDNHRGGVDHFTSLYDFVGRVLGTKATHTAVSAPDRIVARRLQYDHAGRLKGIWHTTGGAAEVQLTQNEYNELGELVIKRLHSEDGISFKQVLDYRYNIRGWLTQINDAGLNADNVSDPKDLFGMNILYNNADPDLNNSTFFNGNISAIKYSSNVGPSQLTHGTPTARGYVFNYDALNRLKSAHHAVNINGWTTSPDYHERDFSYDLNGNILGLVRTDTAALAIDVLSYDYDGNRLLSVTDQGNATKGFKDASTVGADYSYDANGNMTSDKNKGIDSILYNYLNLPARIVKHNGEFIRYIYSAAGEKLSQEVYDAQGNIQKRTDYIGEYVYENDTLKFIQHEEGRVVMTGAASPEYQYHLKDHLGNVRTTFTSRVAAECNTATMEATHATDEQAQFINYETTRKINSTVFDHTNNGTTTTAMRLIGGGSTEVYGPAKSLSVMPGDTLRLEVYAKYLDPNRDNWTGALKNAIAAIAGTPNASGTYVEGGAMGSFEGIFPFPDVLERENDIGTGPKAYLNYIIFNRQMKPLDGGFKRVSTAARESGQATDTTQGSSHERLYFNDIVVTEPGYVYIYLSNENETPVEVFFDDFKVEHIQSPVVQMDDYYPFGMSFNSYSRENSVAQDYKFNGKEEQTELNLGLLDFEVRHYDPALGRFLSIDPLSDLLDAWSPYHFGYNNPLKFNDPTGMIPERVDNGRQDITSTFIKPDGTIIEHRDDNDPTIYLVTDEDAWIKGGRSKDGLDAVGIENPDHEYIPGEKVQLLNYDHNLLGLATGRADPDYTIESFAIPLFGWLKWVRWGKLTFNITSKIAKQLAKRGWTDDLIEQTVNKAHTTRKATNRATGNPATAYFRKDGSHVVVDDVTKDVIQVSNRNDIKNWIPDATIVDPYIPK